MITATNETERFAGKVAFCYACVAVVRLALTLPATRDEPGTERKSIMTKAQPCTPNKEPSVAQRFIGDFAPKLVELTDDVLIGDVWA